MFDFGFNMMSNTKASTPTCVDVQGDDLFIGAGTSNISTIPLYGLFDYSFSAQIWKQAEMGNTKQITGFKLRFQGYTSGYQYHNQKLYLAHVEENQFTEGTKIGMSNMTIKNLKLVKSFDFTPVNNIQNQFDLDNNFCYNGVDNIMLIWKNFKGSWASGFGSCRRMILSGEIPTILYYQDDTFPSDEQVAFTSNLRNNITWLF